MNTRILYQYRDASNYKLRGEVVLKGELSLTELEPFLIEGKFFVPEEFNIPCLLFDNSNEDDHEWHEIIQMELCEDFPDTTISAAELLRLAQESPNDRSWKPYYQSNRGNKTMKAHL